MNSWTVEHWTNFALFVGTILLTGLGEVATWADLPKAVTPSGVAGFGMAVITFLKMTYTNRPRDPLIGERRSDPNRTVPIMDAVSPSGKAVVVPAAVENPGRPVEDQQD